MLREARRARLLQPDFLWMPDFTYSALDRQRASSLAETKLYLPTADEFPQVTHPAHFTAK